MSNFPFDFVQSFSEGCVHPTLHRFTDYRPHNMMYADEKPANVQDLKANWVQNRQEAFDDSEYKCVCNSTTSLQKWKTIPKRICPASLNCSKIKKN